MKVMGVDPGLETTGVGVVEIRENKYFPVYCGCIETKKYKSIPERLKKIYSELNRLIVEYAPDSLAIEDIFFSSNAKTAFNIGQARGISILAGSQNNISIYEYTPLQVKLAIVGYGKATKKQIKYMLKVILNVEDNFFTNKDDAWDAMAVALCHASYSKFNSRVEGLKI
ncbi:MAG: crossover junction endodeoxyribonuclease RuvC [Actinobacteria bacterium]|nr:crossover junction endodeoxyribonuclease RuvC [Actinomycetota bacterium]